MAGKIGFSAEELAKLLSESEAVRRRAENHDALESSNAFVERHGLPLATHATASCR
jgi:post-segregation antitoxin (ccd killing protein)